MTIGSTVAHYTIVRALGSGGMGDVYEASDARLNRRVALKVLPDAMAADPERLERFRREAQAVAALNHPNIVTLHSVEEAAGIHFITMELVEGRTLEALIGAGGVSIDTFFRIAVPMADAVAAAHERGIIHRDLKPANVMLTNDERIKVLDFGLAKQLEDQSPIATTMAADQRLTEEGTIVGTVAYMSPEQAEGRTVDRRSDIFSLGVMLYEMATGRRPFIGDTRLSVLAAIVRDTPASVTELNARLPLHLGRIIRKALEKSPTRRYQTAVDLRNDLEALKHEIDSGEIVVSGGSISDPEARRLAPQEASRRRGLPALAAAGAIALVAMAALGWRTGWFDRPPSPVSTSVTAITSTGHADAPSISPDGQWIAYGVESEGAIYLRSLGDDTAVLLTRDVPGAGLPAFSPDGTLIAFGATNFAPGATNNARGIYVMGRMGGNLRKLTDFGFNPSWSPDGRKIVFGLDVANGVPYSRNFPTKGLAVVDVASGEVTNLDIGDAVQPAWSPSGQRIAFWGMNDAFERDIYTVDAAGGPRVAVTQDVHVDHSPAWSPDGRWLYFASTRGGRMAIWRVAIDERTGQPRGDPQPITTGGVGEPGMLSLSADGSRLVYRELLVHSRIDAVDFDTQLLRAGGDRQTVVQDSRRLVELDISPDGLWLAYRTLDARQDIYVARTDGSPPRQVTDDLAKDWLPRWSPDSRRLAFYSNASGSYQIWTINPDGTGRRQLTNAPGGSLTYDPVWSPDGTEIVYFDAIENDSFVIRSDLPFAEQQPRRLPRPSETVRFRAFEWSGLTGKLVGTGAGFVDVLVFAPKTGVFELVKTGNIGGARQSPDGRHVYYRSGQTWMALDTVTRIERPIALPPDTYLRVLADGRRAFIATRDLRSDVWMIAIR